MAGWSRVARGRLWGPDMQAAIGLGHREAMGLRRTGGDGVVAPVEAIRAQHRRCQCAALAVATGPVVVLMAIVRREEG
ncbi:hypothetical protein GUJ93_ZPchr0012g21821 [Zizania palustris]|uniref:Uncharacterized protein n=1 Tax=Zizania palustris TaxID=103762 RepID=A0A8J5WTC5_ZIZPA|nr:hypothetical protein GUJ93_ZPchr0012g21821 [Zizania palustris]